jgi:hypothetical protein
MIFNLKSGIHVQYLQRKGKLLWETKFLYVLQVHCSKSGTLTRAEVQMLQNRDYSQRVFSYVPCMQARAFTGILNFTVPYTADN